MAQDYVMLNEEKDDSMIAINKSVFKAITEISIDDIAAGNLNLIQNKPQTGNRQLFYEMLERNPRKAFEKLCKVKHPGLLKRIVSALYRRFKSKYSL